MSLRKQNQNVEVAPPRVQITAEANAPVMAKSDAEAAAQQALARIAEMSNEMAEHSWTSTSGLPPQVNPNIQVRPKLFAMQLLPAILTKVTATSIGLDAKSKEVKQYFLMTLNSTFNFNVTDGELIGFGPNVNELHYGFKFSVSDNRITDVVIYRDGQMRLDDTFKDDLNAVALLIINGYNYY